VQRCVVFTQGCVVFTKRCVVFTQRCVVFTASLSATHADNNLGSTGANPKNVTNRERESVAGKCTTQQLHCL
jgi:hypothetical protein